MKRLLTVRLLLCVLLALCATCPALAESIDAPAGIETGETNMPMEFLMGPAPQVGVEAPGYAQDVADDVGATPDGITQDIYPGSPDGIATGDMPGGSDALQSGTDIALQPDGDSVEVLDPSEQPDPGVQVDAMGTLSATDTDPDAALAQQAQTTQQTQTVQQAQPAQSPATPADTVQEEDPWPRTIVITVGGDTTLGCTDAQREMTEGFAFVVNDMGYAWPFSVLQDVFAYDDLTLVNLEGPLTDAETKTEKKFNFKGPAEYTQMLALGSVEAVNLANNHFIDYGDQGKADTRTALETYGITYCEPGHTAIYETRGVKIGLIGNTFAYKDGQCDISKDVKALREAGCQIVVASFHWGSEYQTDYTRDQRNIGRAAIRSGADIVVGHHPHVIQGIEAYEGTYILYSLGNLVFGGNSNPDNRETYIAQLTFTVQEDGQTSAPELKIFPMLVTSQTKGTDYRPVFAEGETYDNILKTIIRRSPNMDDFVNPN